MQATVNDTGSLDSPTNPWKTVGKTDPTGNNTPNGILKKQDVVSMQTMTKQDLMGGNKGRMKPLPDVQNIQPQEDTDGDGLGTQWMKGLYEEAPFSPQGSAINFLSRDSADDSQVQSTLEGTPGDQTVGAQKTPSPTSRRESSARTNQDESTSGTNIQTQILLDGFNDLDDDPRDLLLYQMDEAIMNVGGTSTMFDQEQKAAIADLWFSWQFTSWELLQERLSDKDEAKQFVIETVALVKQMFQHVPQDHPGHVMVSTIASYGPYYAGRHVFNIKAKRTEVPISDYRLFGDPAFCRTWKKNLGATGIGVTDDEMKCLQLGLDPRDVSVESTINISSDSPVTQVVLLTGRRCGICSEETKVATLKTYRLLLTSTLPTILVAALVQAIHSQQVKSMLRLRPYRLLMTLNFLRWNHRIPAPIFMVISSVQDSGMWNGHCILRLW